MNDTGVTKCNWLMKINIKNKKTDRLVLIQVIHFDQCMSLFVFPGKSNSKGFKIQAVTPFFVFLAWVSRLFRLLKPLV